MKKHLLFIIAFILVVNAGISQSDSTLFLTKDSVTHSFRLNQKWKFSPHDDSLMALTNYDDSKWTLIEPSLTSNNKLVPVWKGVGWFRLHFNCDSSLVNLPLALGISHSGASEIYLDGIKLETFGKIKNKDSTSYYDPQDLPVAFAIHNSGHHLLAVRYANFKAEHNFSAYNIAAAGFKMTVGLSKNLIFLKDLRSIVGTFVLMLLSGFFLSFCLIHFLLFLLNRTIKSNLYFSIFMLSLALSHTIFFISFAVHNPVFVMKSIYILNPICVLACLSLSGFINELFQKRKLRFKLIALIGGIIIVFRFLNIDYYASLTVALVIGVAFEAVFTVIFAIVKKVKGAWIIGTGILFFALFVLTILFIAITQKENLDINDSTLGGQILIVILFLAIISIPMAMSVYLAWNFSSINRNLSLQLEQVKVLSEKSIQQEKEKQKILELQNEVLEEQVTLRTTEVVNQKELVELKNKEITDSIEYALRIQTAILPPSRIVKQYLEDSFIVYKPKDIVAGDFYWMETVNDLVLFAACDCTGHGVPGAMVSVVCHNALNRAVREFGLIQPAAILDKTAEIVIENFSKSEENIKDGMDISLCSYNVLTKKLEWAGANNPLWILRNSAADKELANEEFVEVKGDKQPIGMNEDSKPFTNHTFQLTTGDKVYLFSDGFADQFNGENKLTRKKFKELLLSIHNNPMHEQGIQLDTFIDNYREETEQTDDILVMGVRI